MLSLFGQNFFTCQTKNVIHRGKGTRKNGEIVDVSSGHSNAGQNSRDLWVGNKRTVEDKENGRDTAKWHGVSFQSVTLWNEKVLDQSG